MAVGSRTIWDLGWGSEYVWGQGYTLGILHGIRLEEENGGLEMGFGNCDKK